MRRTLFGIVVLLLTMTLSAWAQATQPCIVKQYNQKQPKTPLAGVEVMASNAGSTVSATDGSLTLSFRTLKPGDKVNLISAKKAGYEIFNTEAVAQWNISRTNTPFSIVLVKSDYFAQLKGKLTQTSTDNYKSKYEQAVRELERQKKAGQLKEEEYNKKYDELEETYQNQLKSLDNYIDQFARIDLSEVSAEEQRILELVEEGKIDEAVKAYEELGLIDKFSTEASSYKILNDAAKRIEEELQQRRNNIDELYEAVQRQVSTLILANKNYDARNILLSLTQTLQPLFDENPEEYLPRLAKSLLLLGQVTYYKEQKEHLINAFQHYSILYAKHPEEYLADWSKTNMLLGLNNEVKRKDKIDYLTTAKKGYKKLTVLNPDIYQKELARTLYKLGTEQYQLNNDDSAEVNLLEAIVIYKTLSNQNPKEYKFALANANERLAHVYGSILRDAYRGVRGLRKDEGEGLERDFNSARELAYRVDPDNYKEHLAAIKDIFHDIHSPKYVELCEKEERYLSEAINNLKELIEITSTNNYNFSSIVQHLVYIQKSLALHYQFTFRYEDAEKTLKEAYENCQTCYKINDVEDAFIVLYERTNLQNSSDEYGSFLTKTLEKRLKIDEEKIELNKDKKGTLDEVYLSDQTKDLLILTGYYHLAKGDLEKAETCLDRLFKDSGYSRFKAKELLNDLALKYAEKQEYEKAFDLIKLTSKNYYSSTKSDDYYPIYFVTKGKILLMQGDDKGAYQMWKKFSAYSSDLSIGYSLIYDLSKTNPKDYLGELARTQNEIGMSFSNYYYYEMALKFYSESKKNYTILFEQTGEDDPNKKLYNKNISIILFNTALLYYNTERYPKAKELFSEIENEELTKEKATWQLAKAQRMLYFIYKKEKNEDKQIQYLRKAINSLYEYGSETYRTELVTDLRQYCNELYRTANLQTKNGNYKKAEKDYLLIIDIYEELIGHNWYLESALAKTLNQLSYNYLHQKKKDKALETIDKAISINPKEANLYDSKGEILLMKGDAQDALEMWNKVLELDPDFLSKHDGTTPLYEQLKERGLIK